MAKIFAIMTPFAYLTILAHDILLPAGMVAVFTLRTGAGEAHESVVVVSVLVIVVVVVSLDDVASPHPDVDSIVDSVDVVQAGVSVEGSSMVVAVVSEATTSCSDLTGRAGRSPPF